MASFLLNLLPKDLFFDSGVELHHHKITYGFNATNDMVLNDGMGTEKFTKPMTFTNTMTLLGKTSVRVYHPLGINDGINTNFVNTEGEVDVAALYHPLNGLRFGINARRGPIGIPYESVSDRNLVLPIYNMLRLYFIKRWASVRYEPDEVFYDDGHIRISNKQMYGCAESGILGASPVSNVPVIKLWNPINADISYEDSICINWRSYIYPKQVRVIQHAFGAWESDTPFILHHDCPMFYKTVYINEAYSEPDIEEETRDYTERDVLITIRNFVIFNRAWTHFYYAFIMLCQAMVLPTPRKAKSVAWTVNPIEIRLPRPSNWMGWFGELHDGPHLEMETEAEPSLEWFLSNPDATLWAAIALIEGSYMMLPLMRMYQVGTRHAGSDWLRKAISNSSFEGGGLQVDLALIATLTGHDITLAYPVTCGVNRTILADNAVSLSTEVEVLDSKLPEGYSFVEDKLTANKIMTLRLNPRSPSVYPVLFYGVRSYDYYGDALSSKLSFRVSKRRSSENAIYFTSEREFADFMNIARLTGNDVVATALPSYRKIINRADNCIGRFLRSDIPNEVDYGFLVRFNDVQPRSECWLDVADLRGDVSLELNINSIRYFIKYGRDDHKAEDRAIVSLRAMRKQLLSYEDSEATDKVIMRRKHTIKALQVQEEDFHSLSLGLAAGSGTQGTTR